MSTPLVDQFEDAIDDDAVNDAVNDKNAVVLGGRYVLRGPLGAGGMAQVFEAWDNRLGRLVAVKILRPELASVTSLRRRFELEAQAAARLSHPNVVAVFDAGSGDGRSFIVMERLSGESLADVIGRGPVDQAWLRRITGEVLSALGAAHEAGIIHRDVKPANILLGPDGRAKVADFGIARVVEPETGGSSAGAADAASGPPTAAALTGVGLVLGTTSYLAPERARGEAATARSDLYSLGVVMYEALTGVKPFAGSTPAAIAAAADQRAAPDPSAIRPDADADLVAVIAKAMQPDPAGRYPSAAAMAQDLWQSTPGHTAVMPAVGGRSLPQAQVPTALVAADAGLAAGAGLAGDGVAGEAIARGGPVGDGFVGDGFVGDGFVAGARPRLSARRRRLMMAAAVAAAVVLVIAMARPATHSAASATTATTAASPPTTVAATTNPAVSQLRAVASRLAGLDSSAAQQVAAGMVQVASITDPGARASTASAVLAEAAAWYHGGQLSAGTYQEVAQALQAVGAKPVATVAPVRKPKRGGKGNSN